MAATVGGTTSRLTGGKFANGALTAAFARALGDAPGLFEDSEPELGLNLSLEPAFSDEDYARMEGVDPTGGRALDSFIDPTFIIPGGSAFKLFGLGVRSRLSVNVGKGLLPPYINYWDYTKLKRKSGGIKEVISVEQDN